MATVLVVDDEPDIRYLTQLNLESAGHRVMTAANGIEALAAVEAELPDVVLLDVMMPGVTGWEVLEQLKAHLDDRISSVRVLMMTALGTEHDQARGGIEGAIRYLVKPVTPDEIRSAVDEVMSGPPESRQRLSAQTDALSTLARIESGSTAPAEPQPKLTRLERPSQRPAAPAEPERREVGRSLTPKQRVLMRALAAAPSVTSVATELGMSRSNIYASLRRVARTLEFEAVPELLDALRSGEIEIDDD